MLDILFIQESKLDESFPAGQFQIPGFKCYRKDVRSNCGGLLSYVGDDLIQPRRDDMEPRGHNVRSGRIETMIIEITFRSEKWMYCSLYKQPVVTETDFLEFLEDFVNKIVSKCVNCVLVGDFNIDILKTNNRLNEVLCLLGLQNIVRTPTCYKNAQESYTN